MRRSVAKPWRRCENISSHWVGGSTWGVQLFDRSAILRTCSFPGKMQAGHSGGVNPDWAHVQLRRHVCQPSAVVRNIDQHGRAIHSSRTTSVDAGHFHEGQCGGTYPITDGYNLRGNPICQ